MGTEKLTKMTAAQIAWRGQTPVSQQFDDIYFSAESAVDESQHTFMQGNDLCTRWQNRESSFVVAETGFGSGLNFLLACCLWLRESAASAVLHYNAVDLFPLTKADLQQVLASQPVCPGCRRQLLDRYPPLVLGTHRLSLCDGRVILNLSFMDVEQWLQSMRFRADAWFLDGFAPAVNKSMWTAEVCRQLAQHTQLRGTVASFTSAGWVRRQLQSAGFAIEKCAAYGRKREMLRGRLLELAQPDKAATPPWFQYQRQPGDDKNMLVIGAGLGGAFTADSFARRGWQVTVLERHAQPAQEASGNRSGVIFSKFSAFDGLDYRFYQQAYLYAVTHFPDLLTDRSIWSDCGVLQLAFSEKEQLRQQQLSLAALWPQEWLQAVGAEQASELCGLPLRQGGLWCRQAGWVAPAAVCQHLLAKHAQLRCHYSAEVAAIEYDSANASWQAFDQHGQLLAAAPVVVIATAANLGLWPYTADLPVSQIRGQVTEISASDESAQLRCVLCYDGYLTPAVAGVHSLGASYDHQGHAMAPSTADQAANLSRLEGVEPPVYRALCGVYAEPEVVDNRVGFRCHSPDYLPIVGPLADQAFFATEYAGLAKGQLKRAYPQAVYYPGLYVNVAHGSRGVTSAPFCAELLAAYINNEPQPVTEALRIALHPARFLIKDLKRGRLQKKSPAAAGL